MSDGPAKHDKPFLHRWSQRKLAAAREGASDSKAAKVAGSGSPQPAAAPAAAPAPAPAPAVPVVPAAASAPAPVLPPIEALTFDSDFSAFLRPDVDASLRQRALRKLFSDPRFNVNDGLDVYIDDYTKFEPLPPDLVSQLRHAKDVLDPPRTRVNAQGHVENAPPEVEAASAGADSPPEEAAGGVAAGRSDEGGAQQPAPQSPDVGGGAPAQYPRSPASAPGGEPVPARAAADPRGPR